MGCDCPDDKLFYGALRYRKLPVEVMALRYDGMNGRDIVAWVMGGGYDTAIIGDNIHIETLEGTMKARIGDYIVKGVAGEFYPVHPGIFESTYRLLPDDD